jgi:hypothetical protein
VESVPVDLPVPLSPHLFWNKKRKYGADRMKVRGRWERCLTPLVRCRSCSTDTISASAPTSRPMSRERWPAIDPIVISKFNTLHSPCFEFKFFSSRQTHRTERIHTIDRCAAQINGNIQTIVRRNQKADHRDPVDNHQLTDFHEYLWPGPFIFN